MDTGTIISGRYKLVEKIGVGGFAQVWKAQDQMADDTVLAIKIFAADTGLDSDGLRQFRKEYALVLNLNHPNLLTARHFDIWEGRPYLIMPYIQEGSLATRLLRKGTMSSEELGEMIRQISSALAYLHENGIIHQDVKPDNILIGSRGEYLLSDFGISSRLKSTLRKSTRTAGTLTIAYAPPERFDAKPRQLPAGDVFSLGVVLFEMATGDVPWMGNGGVSLKIGAEIPELTDDMPEVLKELMNQMLLLSPEDRIDSKKIAEILSSKKETKEENKRITEELITDSSRKGEERETKKIDRVTEKLIKSEPVIAPIEVKRDKLTANDEDIKRHNQVSAIIFYVFILTTILLLVILAFSEQKATGNEGINVLNDIEQYKTAQVTLKTNPSNAIVMLNQRTIGASNSNGDFNFVTEEGNVNLTIHKIGYETYSRELQISSNAYNYYEITLREK